VRGVALEAPAEGGIELAVTSDAVAVRTSCGKTPGLAAATAHVTRLRLGLEGSWRGLALDDLLGRALWRAWISVSSSFPSVTAMSQKSSLMKVPQPVP